MELDPSRAHHIAQKYLGTTRPLTRLGWGVSGFVVLAPDLRSAVKVHRTLEGYATELRAYKLLKRLRISTIHGLTVPKLRGYRSAARVIRMDFVSPPFLLDFTGVQFDPPEFSGRRDGRLAPGHTRPIRE